MDNVLKPHAAAELFPLLSDVEFDQLKADIQANGLKVPILISAGQILDGRNRYRASLELGIEPRFTEYKGDSPFTEVWSLNGTRRHMDKGDLAVIAVIMLPEIQEEAKKRQTAAGMANLRRGKDSPISALEQHGKGNEIQGEAVAIAAKRVGVGKTLVQQAAAIQKANPVLFERIKKREITVNKAMRILTEHARETKTKVLTPDQEAIKVVSARTGVPEDALELCSLLIDRAPDLVARIQDGHLTISEATLLFNANLPDEKKLSRRVMLKMQRLAVNQAAELAIDEARLDELMSVRLVDLPGPCIKSAAKHRPLSTALHVVYSIKSQAGALRYMPELVGVTKDQAEAWTKSIDESIQAFRELQIRLQSVA